jgi:uncharacterized protein (TIGR00251 family)
MAIQVIETADGLMLNLKVVPGSSRDRIAGEYASGLKVNVSTAPQRGAANEAVIALLAGALQIPAKNIRIVRGQTSARKQVLIQGMTVQTLRNRLSGQ